MPFTLEEIVTDLPAVLSIVEKLETAIAALPPVASRKAADYAALFNSVDLELASLIDQIEAQAKS